MPGTSYELLTFLQSGPRLLNRLQVPLAPKDIHDISLFSKHMPIRLNTNPRQTAPPLEICRIPFIPMCCIRIFPMAFKISLVSIYLVCLLVLLKGKKANRQPSYLWRKRALSLFVSWGCRRQAIRHSPFLRVNAPVNQWLRQTGGSSLRTPAAGIIRTFKPIALPQLARPDALKATRLEIGPACHWTTVDLIHDAVLCRKNEDQKSISVPTQPYYKQAGTGGRKREISQTSLKNQIS